MGKKKDERVYAIESSVGAIDFQLINDYNVIVKGGKKHTLKYRVSDGSQISVSEEDGVLKVKEQAERESQKPKTAMILTLPKGSVFALKGAFDGNVSLKLPEIFGYKNIELAVVGKTCVDLGGSVESLAMGVSGSLTLNTKNLKCPSVAINSSGSATVTLAGEGEALSAEVSGMCRVYAKGFYLFRANADVSGLAVLNIKVKEQINLNASGVANVNYYGEPSVNNVVTGVAKVKKVGKIEKTQEEKQAEKELKLQKKKEKKELSLQKKQEKQAKKQSAKASADVEKSV